MRDCKFIGIIAMLFSLVSCDSGNKSLLNEIKNACPNKDQCTIEMASITDFKWEKMYVIKEGISLEETNEIIGFRYPYFTDIARRIIFVSGNEVVYHEDEFPNPSERQNEKLFFKYPTPSEKYMSFTPDNAIFNLKKSEIKGRMYYEIIPLYN